MANPNWPQTIPNSRYARQCGHHTVEGAFQVVLTRTARRFPQKPITRGSPVLAPPGVGDNIDFRGRVYLSMAKPPSLAWPLTCISGGTPLHVDAVQFVRIGLGRLVL